MSDEIRDGGEETTSAGPGAAREPEPATKRSGARGKAVVEGSLWSAGVLLVAALFLFVNYFGLKYYQRFDWTGSKLYSLSEKTESILSGLDRDVKVTVFLQPSSNLHGPTKELLDRYAAASPRIEVRFVDPEKNLIEAQRLVDRYQVSALNVVVFEAGDDRRVVDTSNLADWDYSGLQFGAEPTMTAFKGEEAFTGAILELAEGRKPKVLFTTGHGERALEETGNDGMSRISELLGKENLDLESWASLGQERVPEGTDLVVVAGPRVAFLPPELDALGRYLDAGGRMLVLLDPVLDNQGGLVDTGMANWLAARGVEVGDDLVVDPSAALPFFGAETIYAGSVGTHPIVESLGQARYPVIVALARSVRPGSPPAGYRVTGLLQTTAEGWGETDLAHLDAVARGDDDTAGPVSLAVAVSAEEKKPGPVDDEQMLAEEGAEEPAAADSDQGEAPSWRLVVVGDSDLATNGQLASVGNPTLVANAFNWLLERQKLLGIGPKKPEQVRLNLTSGQLSAITWTALAGLPLLAVLAGFAVWSRRRR